MDLMMENMDNVEDTGNASLDFLYGMIPHHEAAIDMSRSYLKHAGDKARFSEMANDIISAQDQEIDQMNDMIKESKNPAGRILIRNRITLRNTIK